MILWISNLDWTRLAGSFFSTALLHCLPSGQLGIVDLFCTLSQLCDYGWVKGADFAPNYVLSAASRLASNCTHDAWVGFLESGSMQGALAG